MVKKILLGMTVFSMLTLFGCNTVAGFGKDVGKLGGKIENKAEQKKNY